MSKLAFADVIYWHFMQFAMLFILFGGIKLLSRNIWLET
jgi:hypothetical protein